MPAPKQLRSEILFGFVLAQYRPREKRGVLRLPTPRASIYFAANVQDAVTGARVGTGLFCEGPHSSGFLVTHECDEMVALKVRGGGLRELLGVPAKELRDETIPLEEVWGKSASAIVESMVEAGSATERLHLLEKALAQRARHRPSTARLARAAVNVIEASGGNIQVTELSRRLGCSRRSLVNVFDEWVGLNPKQYARLVRLRTALARSLSDDGPDWATVAAECGFCDQAHLIHECHALMGCTPGALVDTIRAGGPRPAPTRGHSVVPENEQRLYSMVGLVSEWVNEPRQPRSQRLRAAKA